MFKFSMINGSKRTKLAFVNYTRFLLHENDTINSCGSFAKTYRRLIDYLNVVKMSLLLKANLSKSVQGYTTVFFVRFFFIQ